MAEKKMCPHCGGQIFMAKVTRACVVEITTDSNEPYNILKESKDKFDVEILKCARCKEDVTETELVAGVKCKECGKIVGPMDVNKEGICNVCDAVKQRTELANASREDLIKMLLDAEKRANPVAVKMEKHIEKADNVSTENNTQVETESVAEAKKVTRKVSRKKKDSDVDNSSENNTEETTETTEEAIETEAINNLANQQEAPFPDVAMNPPEVKEQSIQEEEHPIGADFRMFDEGEEPF